MGSRCCTTSLFAADHHAITAFQTPDAAAGAHIHIMNFFRRQFPARADVIDIVGIAAVNEDVAGGQQRQQQYVV